jgi:hypothetical protein
MTNSHQKSLSALATIGAYWVLTNNGPCSMHPRLRRRDDGRWVCPEFAEGLAPAEAFGLTLAVRWAELDERGEAVQLVSSNGDAGGWLVALPGEPARVLPVDRAAVVTRALLEVRRTVRPPRPFALRDQVAERLQLHLRAMEAQLRGWTPVVTIHPPVIRSDLGRDWSGGYTCRG